MALAARTNIPRFLPPPGAGPTAAIPSAALRATGLRIVGSGQGSVSTRAIVEELPALAAELSKGTFTVDPSRPLSDVEPLTGATPAASCSRPKELSVSAYRHVTGPASGLGRSEPHQEVALCQSA